MIAAFRISDEPSTIAPQDFQRGGLTAGLITPGCAAPFRATARSAGGSPIGLPAADGGTVPGIVVGQQLEFPEVGAYEFYFAYDLAPEQQTLQFVQITLWLVGAGLCS
jgi:two-component system sensor histidine kinase MtrB